MRTPIAPISGVSARSVNGELLLYWLTEPSLFFRRHSFRKLTGDEAPANTAPKQPSGRKPLSARFVTVVFVALLYYTDCYYENRMSTYEEVGVSFSGLQKETARRGSALRRDSYNTQGSKQNLNANK